MTQSLQRKAAHMNALKGILQHASIGRVPMLDYACEFARNSDNSMPDSPVALIEFLDDTEKIKDDSLAHRSIQQAYTKIDLPTPVAIEDLPIWWAQSIIKELEHPKAKAVMGWDSVFLQGAFLDIQFTAPIESNDTTWPTIGAALMRLHRNFIPGPFTPAAQLEEFL